MTPEETYAMLKKIERVFAGSRCTKKKGLPRALFPAPALPPSRMLIYGRMFVPGSVSGCAMLTLRCGGMGAQNS